MEMLQVLSVFINLIYFNFLSFFILTKRQRRNNWLAVVLINIIFLSGPLFFLFNGGDFSLKIFSHSFTFIYIMLVEIVSEILPGIVSVTFDLNQIIFDINNISYLEISYQKYIGFILSIFINLWVILKIIAVTKERLIFPGLFKKNNGFKNLESAFLPLIFFESTGEFLASKRKILTGPEKLNKEIKRMQSQSGINTLKRILNPFSKEKINNAFNEGIETPFYDEYMPINLKESKLISETLYPEPYFNFVDINTFEKRLQIYIYENDVFRPKSLKNLSDTSHSDKKPIDKIYSNYFDLIVKDDKLNEQNNNYDFLISYFTSIQLVLNNFNDFCHNNIQWSETKKNNLQILIQQFYNYYKIRGFDKNSQQYKLIKPFLVYLDKMEISDDLTIKDGGALDIICEVLNQRLEQLKRKLGIFKNFSKRKSDLHSNIIDFDKNQIENIIYSFLEILNSRKQSKDTFHTKNLNTILSAFFDFKSLNSQSTEETPAKESKEIDDDLDILFEDAASA